MGVGEGDGTESEAPRGPSGSVESSTGWRIVDCASTFLAGGFRPPAGLEVAAEDEVVVAALTGSAEADHGVRSV